jgi:hypothetical protein
MAPVNAALQGLVTAERSLEKVADRVARRSSPDIDTADTVSLTDDAVGLLSARDMYQMNLQVLKVTDDTARKLVDFLA